MSGNKYSASETDLNKPYEQNEIQLKGILGFGIGLVLLIVVTFGLMWALLNVLRDYSLETAARVNPMAMSDKERLPPEPRLQGAPGFGVESPHGRVNMELGEPQAEYRELRKQWHEMWEHGLKDEKTGVSTSMPLHEAKEKLLGMGVKSKAGIDPDAYNKSRAFVSDASSGRVASEHRR